MSFGGPGFLHEGVITGGHEYPGEALARLRQTARIEAEILQVRGTITTLDGKIPAEGKTGDFEDVEIEVEGKEG